MKNKYWAIGLTLALVLGMVACGHQAEQEPQQLGDVQKVEPAASEPLVTAQPVDVKQEAEPPASTVAPTEEPPDSADPVETAGEGEEVQLFTDCNETVWATGTVNLRSGPSTDFDNVGSLNKGDSVTRIGIGINEAEGWSRVKLSNGSEVYVSNKYISTTKPVVQQPQQVQNNTKTDTNTQQKPAETQTPQQTKPEQQKPTETQTPQQTKPTETNQPGYPPGMTKEEIAEIEAARQQIQAALDAKGAGGIAIVDPKTGNIHTMTPGSYMGSIDLN